MFYLALSELLTHNDYWGARQQLLAGKFIVDWIDVANEPLDPIFGVLLYPVAGGWIDPILY